MSAITKSENNSIPANEETRPSSSPVRPLPTPSTPPPNGGVVAWLQVLGAAFLFFNSW